MHLDAKRLGVYRRAGEFQGSSGVHPPIADISQLYSSGSMRYKPAAAALRPDGASTKLRVSALVAEAAVDRADLTVLSILRWPSKSWIARKFPVRR